MLANDPTQSRLLLRIQPEDSPRTDGSAPVGPLGGEKTSLGSSDQSKPDIDISLWTILFQDLSLLSLVGKGSFGRVSLLPGQASRVDKALHDL